MYGGRKYTEEGKKSVGMKFFSHNTIPFRECLLHFYWSSTIYCLPRGQSCLTTWKQLLTAWGTEFFHYRHVLYLGSERHHCSMRYIPANHSVSVFGKLHTRFLARKVNWKH
jgi:hypothetical protein